MKIDLHVHTTHSGTSSVTVANMADFVKRTGARCATITDFGTMRGVDELRERLPQCTVFAGVEVRAPLGDFLVFSTDEDYLRSLPANIDSVRDLRRDDQTAVIWAHPYISQRAKTYEVGSLPEVEAVLPYVDGLELFNGTMIRLNQQHLLQTGYFQNLMRIATEAGLTMTGGSDAHEPENLGHCFTRFSGEIGDAKAFVSQLKNRHAMPGYDHGFFSVEIPLG